MESTKFSLISVIQDLARARELDTIMNIVGEATREFTGADGATFVLREGDFSFYADENAIGPLWKGKLFPLGNCISGWAMLNGKPAVVSNIFEDPRIPVDLYRPTFVKSLVMVPMRTSSPIGAIGNYWARPHTATDEQIEFLQAVADTAAVALENVSLHRSLQSRLEDLKASNRAKDEFLMLVSHELRTPLNAIQGWTQLLSDEQLSRQETRQGLETIQRNVQRQIQIIDDLMDASSIVLDTLALRPQTMALQPLIEAALAPFEAQADARRIQLNVALERRPLKATVDSDRFQQACGNVFANAIKFTPNGGTISVTLTEEGPSARLQISDSGEGFTPEDARHLFKRFSRVDASLARPHGGLGLGLAITKHLIEAFKGTVTGTSPGPGRGAVFTIDVPLAGNPSW